MKTSKLEKKTAVAQPSLGERQSTDALRTQQVWKSGSNTRESVQAPGFLVQQHYGVLALDTDLYATSGRKSGTAALPILG